MRALLLGLLFISIFVGGFLGIGFVISYFLPYSAYIITTILTLAASYGLGKVILEDFDVDIY